MRIAAPIRVCFNRGEVPASVIFFTNKAGVGSPRHQKSKLLEITYMAKLNPTKKYGRHPNPQHTEKIPRHVGGPLVGWKCKNNKNFCKPRRQPNKQPGVRYVTVNVSKILIARSGLRFFKTRIVAEGFNTRSLERSISSNNTIECVHAKNVCVETRLRVKVSAPNTHFRVNKFFSVCKKNGWNRVCVEACSCKSFVCEKQFCLSACESISLESKRKKTGLFFCVKHLSLKCLCLQTPLFFQCLCVFVCVVSAVCVFTSSVRTCLSLSNYLRAKASVYGKVCV